jgi:hypothetical protein
MSIPELDENGVKTNPDPDRPAGKVPQKNKGGRPKGRDCYCNHKVNIYLTDEEYGLFMAFVSKGWHDQNASGAGRYLISTALKEWRQKGERRL